MRILVTMIVAGMLSYAVHAKTSSQMGPNVECQYEDGKTEYLPSMFCKLNGGTVR